MLLQIWKIFPFETPSVACSLTIILYPFQVLKWQVHFKNLNKKLFDIAIMLLGLVPLQQRSLKYV